MPTWSRSPRGPLHGARRRAVQCIGNFEQRGPGSAGAQRHGSVDPRHAGHRCGLRKEVRLDVVDRWPEIGDYLIVHAGFAIHTLDPEEAEKNLKLLKEMAENVIRQDS